MSPINLSLRLIKPGSLKGLFSPDFSPLCVSKPNVFYSLQVYRARSSSQQASGVKKDGLAQELKVQILNQIFFLF